MGVRDVCACVPQFSRPCPATSPASHALSRPRAERGGGDVRRRAKRACPVSPRPRQRPGGHPQPRPSPSHVLRSHPSSGHVPPPVTSLLQSAAVTSLSGHVPPPAASLLHAGSPDVPARAGGGFAPVCERPLWLVPAPVCPERERERESRECSDLSQPEHSSVPPAPGPLEQEHHSIYPSHPIRATLSESAPAQASRAAGGRPGGGEGHRGSTSISTPV